jgi:tetratricopeptide (TPR) repeat protein
MAEVKEKKEQKNVSWEDRFNNFEEWVNNKSKPIGIAVGTLFVIVGGYFAATKFYLEPRADQASNQMFMAEKYFDEDSLSLAMEGDGNYLGFTKIMDEYKWTPSANLAHYYAGIIMLKQEKFQDAINFLSGFNGKDKMVTNMAYGALGDAYSELNQMDKAIDYYKKAAYHFENDLTTPFFLKKAAMLLEVQKKPNDAKQLYEEIKTKYPNSSEGREIDKYLARVGAV